MAAFDCTSSEETHSVETSGELGTVVENHVLEIMPFNGNHEDSVNYRRGDRVFIEKDGKATKAMVCEITPQKTRLKVAVDPKERPLLVKISSLHKPIPHVLRGLTFVIS